MARFYATHRLSERILERPDGSLLAMAAPIARTGKLLYRADDMPDDLAAGAKNGQVEIYRTAEDLFSPATMASYEGAPFVLGHPSDGEDVTPENWAKLAKGHVQNVRQGSGAEADLLLADIVISDAEAIKAIKDGMREISCGYDADYEVIAPGVGRQIQNIGNHIALVPAGRNGPRVAIRDSKTKDKSMTPPKKDGFFKRMRRFMDEEEKAIDEAPGEPAKQDDPPATTDDDEVLLMLRTLVEGMEQVKIALKVGATDAEDPDQQTGDEDLEPTGDADDDPVIVKDEGEDPPATKTGDSRRTADAATIRSALVLAPNLAFRAGDNDQSTKRAALTYAARDAAIDGVIKGVLGKRSISAASPNLVNAAFAAAAAVKRQANTAKTSALGARTRDSRQLDEITPTSLNAKFDAMRKGAK